MGRRRVVLDAGDREAGGELFFYKLFNDMGIIMAYILKCCED